jgi:lysine-N-methylase
MLKQPLPRLQPSYYGAFRCVGAVCEDTCCSGWRIPVDKETYQKYQSCSHSAVGPKLKALVTINANPESNDSWAEIQLDQGHCGFLIEGLCQIQSTLGEELLSKNCAAYPRVMTTIDGVVERSLHLSCPEVARLALTDPQPIQFVPFDELEEAKAGSLGIVDTANVKHPDLREVQSLIIALLQNRAHSLSDRLVMLGRLCGKLESEGADQASLEAPISPRPSMPSTVYFETVVELILARISSDSTSQRFLDCYRSFMSGLHWTMESTMEQLAATLEAAFDGPFAAFRTRHGYMLEHYLVSNVFLNLFPFGSASVNRKLAEYGFEHSVSHQYQLLVANYAVVETMLAGLAAFYGDRFGVTEVLKLIQSATKTFAHSLSFPGKTLELLAQKGVGDCTSVTKLIRAESR